LETHFFSVVVVVFFIVVVFIIVVVVVSVVVSVVVVVVVVCIVVFFIVVVFFFNIAIDKTTRTIDYNAPQCWWKVCFVCCAGAIGVECDVEKKSSGTYQ
jgi:hypothetical protein